MMRVSQRKSAAAGFTMMEALIALVLLMLGILGMGALAGATVRTNMDSQDRTIATNLAEQLLGRLRTEAMSWNETSWMPSQDVPTPATDMPLLSALPTGVATGTTGFQELTQNYDFDGERAFTRELDMVVPSAAGAKYCAHYRLTWLQPNETIRAEVRVYWMRRGADPDAYDFYVNCGRTNVDDLATNVTDVRCVARTAILQRNGSGGQR